MKKIILIVILTFVSIIGKSQDSVSYDGLWKLCPNIWSINTSPTKLWRPLMLKLQADSISYVSGISNDWSLTGNSGTDSSINFIGTIDNKDLIFRQKNIISGIIENDSENTAFGHGSLVNYPTTGTFNSAFGYGAASGGLVGNYNTSLGANSMLSIVTGNYNTAIGYLADVRDGVDNQLALGAYAIATTANQLFFSDSLINLHLNLNGGSRGSVIVNNDGSGNAGWSVGIPPMIVRNADSTGRRGAVASLATYATPATVGSYIINGYLNATSVITDVVQIQVTYTDENSNNVTQILVTGISTSGQNSFYTSGEIRVKELTAITVKSILTNSLGSINYDFGASIMYMGH